MKAANADLDIEVWRTNLLFLVFSINLKCLMIYNTASQG